MNINMDMGPVAGEKSLLNYRDWAALPRKSCREAYGAALRRLGEINDQVVVLEADVGNSTKSVLFSEAFPDRYFNVGIAENNMLGVAAGLAACGKIPFANTFAVFATMRAGDPLRSLIAYTGLNVKVAASYAGLSDSYDGATHQSVEDLAIARALPNLTVLVPADAHQTVQAVMAAAAYRGPVFIRLSRAVLPVIYKEEAGFPIGRGRVLRRGADVTLIACGYMVYKALQAAEMLAADYSIKAGVIDMSTIKPLDTALLREAAEETGRIVTIEEHSIHGGLGSAVAEYLIQHHPVPMRLLGLPDVFGESGDYEALLTHFRLDAPGITKAVADFCR